MKNKGFTLVELLVVIAIIAMLMSILLPAMAMVKAVARKMVCGTNLSAIGKTMVMYSNDYDGSFPVAGGPQAVWCTLGYILDWSAEFPDDAFGEPGKNTATISSSLYLLVKFYEMQPKQFVCKGDKNTKPLKEKDLQIQGLPLDLEFVDVWDFGGDQESFPGIHCSYSYHMPYFDGVGNPGLPITSTSSEASPVCADRNPYLDTNVTMLEEDISNAATHDYEGQNVLFCSGEVSFYKSPSVGIKGNNIWQYNDQFPNQQQIPSGKGDGAPVFIQEEERQFIDAYLVNEDQVPY